MTDFRGSRRSFPSKSNRRRTSWEEGPGGTTLTSSAGSNTNIVGSGAAANEDGLTLLRLRGRLNAVLAVCSAAGDGFQGAFGIGIVKAPAFAIGITAVPSPITEQNDEDWLYWTPISCHGGDATAGSRNWDRSLIDTVVDTKAMRKLNAGDTIYSVLEVIEIGTAELDLFFDSRILVAIP